MDLAIAITFIAIGTSASRCQMTPVIVSPSG